MPRISDAREKLTDAAFALIWTSGYGATSVDDICEKAGVKKGSFYHFFKSKADLEAAALEAYWQRSKPRWDEMFSPAVAPLERLWDYLKYILRRQSELRQEHGTVLGCPMYSVGSEVTTREEGIRSKAMEIMDCQIKYFETAIRDAQAQGLADAPDARTKAQVLFAYIQGVLARARITNSLEPLGALEAGVRDLLGLPAAEAPAGGSAR